MAFKQNILQRLSNLRNTKLSNQILKSFRISSPSSSTLQSMVPSNPDGVAPELGDNSIFRRFLHRRPIYRSNTAALVEIFRQRGEKLLETLREMDIARNRSRIEADVGFTVDDAKKILRASQMEVLKSKLRSSKKNHASYDEFIQMCVDGCCSNRDQGVDLAKVLDSSGSVIVLGNVVFLQPDEVVKAMNELMRLDDDFPVEEFEEMERWKLEIDDKAEKMVRCELWGGLGYLVVQAAVFMRLTFWELSWDVMEPICFFVTSMYFMIGYAYFIRTSREPSFEAVYKSRFHAKQRKLMKMEGFDVDKYNELKKTRESHQPWPREIDYSNR